LLLSSYSFFRIIENVFGQGSGKIPKNSNIVRFEEIKVLVEFFKVSKTSAF